MKRLRGSWRDLGIGELMLMVLSDFFRMICRAKNDER